jgi:hypothetical protein
MNMTTKVTFELPAENVADASEGILLGEFNNWNHAEAVQLVKKEDGSMYAEIALTAGRSYQYRYFLNDGRWVNDHNITTSTEVYGHSVENCVVEVPVVEKKKTAAKATTVKEVKAPKEVKSVKEAKPAKAAKEVKAAKAVKEVKAPKTSKKKI